MRVILKTIFHLYHKALLLIGKTKIGNTKWYKHTVENEAKWVIGTRSKKWIPSWAELNGWGR